MIGESLYAAKNAVTNSKETTNNILESHIIIIIFIIMGILFIQTILHNISYMIMKSSLNISDSCWAQYPIFSNLFEEDSHYKIAMIILDLGSLIMLIRIAIGGLISIDKNIIEHSKWYYYCIYIISYIIVRGIFYLVGLLYINWMGPIVAPTKVAPTTVAPTTVAPTTVAPTTVAPTTVAPTTVAPTEIECLNCDTSDECSSLDSVSGLGCRSGYSLLLSTKNGEKKCHCKKI